MDYSYYDYGDYSSMLNDEAFLLALGIGIIVMLAAVFIAWLITLYPRYYMIKNSGVGPAWSAFIPIWQDIQLFKMAGWPGWSYWVYLGGFTVLSFIPFVCYLAYPALIVFLCILYWRVSANFGLGTCGRILSLFLGWWVYWYVALTKKPYYNLYANNAYQQQDQNWYQNNNQQPQNQNWYQPQNPQQPQQNQEWYQNNNQ